MHNKLIGREFKVMVTRWPRKLFMHMIDVRESRLYVICMYMVSLTGSKRAELAAGGRYYNRDCLDSIIRNTGS